MTTPFDFDLWNSGVKPLVGPAELSEEEHHLLGQLRSMPKVELHLHVEGAIHPDDLVQIAQGHGIHDVAGIPARMSFSDYDSFFQAWFLTTSLLRDRSNFALAAESFAHRLNHAGVVWAEVFVSPPDFEKRDESPLPFARILNWWVESFEVAAEAGPQVRLIVDLVRLYDPNDAERWLDELLEIRTRPGGHRIIGIGLGGPEHAEPLRAYKAVVERARGEGLLCVAHAGENGSGKDVAEALFDLKVDRIGHALGLTNNQSAYRYVLDNQVPIESCPTSNFRAGVISSFSDHPIASWIRDGALVVVGTDDPSLFGTELCLEFLHLHRSFGCGMAELRQLVVNGFDASTMPDELRASFARDLAVPNAQ